MPRRLFRVRRRPAWGLTLLLLIALLGVSLVSEPETAADLQAGLTAGARTETGAGPAPGGEGRVHAPPPDERASRTDGGP